LPQVAQKPIHEAFLAARAARNGAWPASHIPLGLPLRGGGRPNLGHQQRFFGYISFPAIFRTEIRQDSLDAAVSARRFDLMRGSLGFLMAGGPASSAARLDLPAPLKVQGQRHEADDGALPPLVLQALLVLHPITA
jgi:hypothetical protein